MKTPGQLAYEEDCRREPFYPSIDRCVRPTWDQLGEFARQSWELNPTVRAKERRIFVGEARLPGARYDFETGQRLDDPECGDE